MRAVIQRVNEASVTIDGQEKACIGQGLLVYLGIEEEDGQEDISWLTSKISNLRIFSDKNGQMNLSLTDIKGSVLVISQFTLHAQTKKGNRPSFIRAAKPDFAERQYDQFVQRMATIIERTQTGTFGADMKIASINDGPVTIIIDTKNKE